MDIGERIKLLREKIGMSQAELAKKANIAQSSISYIESGGKSPSLETLECICNGLGISLSELLYDEDKADYNNSNDEVNDILETLHKRPEMKTLFSISKKATKEDIERTIKIIEALKGNN